MRKLLILLAAASLTSAHAGEARFGYFTYSGRSQESALAKPGHGQFLNPIVSGYAPDPSIVRVNEDYYLVTSSFVHFPGLPIYHSRDLVTWQQIGSAIDRPSQVDFSNMKVSAGLMAPAISYHDGLFYIVCTNRKNFVITAKDPAGPWSDPVNFDFDGIDPSLFWDQDGKAYIVNNGAPKGPTLYPGHRAIWLQQFDPATRTMIGPRHEIINGGASLSTKPFWTEAPHLIRKDSYYYLIAAQGGTGDQHSEVVFRSRDIAGPYENYPGGPILTQRDLPAQRPHPVGTAGHADFVQTQDGQWWSVFLATRNYGPDLYNIGRETFLLPVTWKDGWPVILEQGKPVPFVLDRPALPAAPPPAHPLNGDYSYTDDFKAPKLGLGWMSVRIPAEPRYTLDHGSLVLKANPEGVGDSRHVPSFIGRKQAHAIATVSTTLRYTAERDGDRAGLVAMQSDDAYLFLGLQRTGGKQTITLSARKSAQDPHQGRVLASVPLDKAGAPLYLKLSIDGGTLNAAYAVQRDAWKSLAADVDARFLSTKQAGGFVGTVIGLYNESAPVLDVGPLAATFTVRGDMPAAKIDRNIYGQFVEHLGRGVYEGIWVGEDSQIPNTRGIRKDVVDALRKLNPPAVRWPGGCYADTYHWRDGIGPRGERPARANTSWERVESNAFGTHEFMDFVEQIGAKPYISVNMGTGTPAEGKAWMEYMTAPADSPAAAERVKNGHKDPWAVPYVGVGNESWGCGGMMRADFYADQFRLFQSFLGTYSGPKAVMIASGADTDDYLWTEKVLAKAMMWRERPAPMLYDSPDPIMGGLSLHFYALPNSNWTIPGDAIAFGEDQWFSNLKRALTMEEIITKHAVIMDKFDPQKKVPLVVDEWGTWFKRTAGASVLWQQNTLRDALVAGVTLNIFHRHSDRVRMANIAQMINVLQSMILTQGEKMIVTPTYHVFEMYKVHQDATNLPIEIATPAYRYGSESIPALSVSASRDRDGAVHVSIVNLNPHCSASIASTLKGITAKTVTGRVLTATAMNDHNDFGLPDRFEPQALTTASIEAGTLKVKVPAKSVTLLELR